MAYQPTAEDKSTGMLCNLLCIFTMWLGPLIMFLVKKDASPFVKLQAKQTLVWGVAIAILCVLFSILGGFVHALIFVYYAVLVVHLVFSIMGTVMANKGEKFIYPVVADMFCKPEITAVYG